MKTAKKLALRRWGIGLAIMLSIGGILYGVLKIQWDLNIRVVRGRAVLVEDEGGNPWYYVYSPQGKITGAISAFDRPLWWRIYFRPHQDRIAYLMMADYTPQASEGPLPREYFTISMAQPTLSLLAVLAGWSCLFCYARHRVTRMLAIPRLATGRDKHHAKWWFLLVGIPRRYTRNSQAAFLVCKYGMLTAQLLLVGAVFELLT